MPTTSSIDLACELSNYVIMSYKDLFFLSKYLREERNLTITNSQIGVKGN